MVEKKESKKLQTLKSNARERSIKEGIFASAKSAFADYYISPLAIAINASNPLVAMLSSISGLLGPLTQMFSSRLLEKHSRKKIISRWVFWEAISLIPFIFIAFLFYKGIISSSLPIILLLVFSVYTICLNIWSPALFSWLGDIVEERERGRWFSKRSVILGFVSIILALSASFILNLFKEKNLVMFGFMALFFLAFISRMISWKIFKKKYEPKLKLHKKDYFPFLDFVIKSPKTNFGRFSIFRALFAFACSISAPLLAVYLLRNLNFDYTTYMIVTIAGSVFSLIVLGFWGKLSDTYGNYRVLVISCILIPVIPILWILSPSPIYLITVPSIIGGMAWAGFNLSTGNFVYDNVTKEKRGFAISYHNMLNGIGVFLGAGFGALLIKILPLGSIEPIFIIFIISSLLRTIIALWWLPKIKEIRETEEFVGRKVLKNIIFKEIKPTIMEEVHQISSIGSYLIKK